MFLTPLELTTVPFIFAVFLSDTFKFGVDCLIETAVDETASLDVVALVSS